MKTDEKVYRFLEWDTKFFGFGIVQLCAPTHGEEELRIILRDLKKEGVKLVYWASDPSDEASQQAARALKGLLVDKKITYNIDLRANRPEPPAFPAAIREYSSIHSSEDLDRLVIECGKYSRFNIDPQFKGSQYEKLYKTWFQKSLTKELADIVLVAEQNDVISGMITARHKNDEGWIGLLAVDDRMQGKNIGMNLVHAANNWFISNNCTHAKVVTQGENGPACRLYEKCGYHPERKDYFFHFWI